MINLIKLILMIYILLTSKNTIKLEKGPYNPNDDPDDDILFSLLFLLIQISLYFYIKNKFNKTNVDKIDETHMEEQQQQKDIEN